MPSIAKKKASVASVSKASSVIRKMPSIAKKKASAASVSKASNATRQKESAARLKASVRKPKENVANASRAMLARKMLSSARTNKIPSGFMVRAYFHVSPFLCVGWGTVLRRCPVYSSFITGLPRNLPLITQYFRKLLFFFEKSREKVWWLQKNTLPLQSLLRKRLPSSTE